MAKKRLWIALLAVPICVVSMLFTSAEKLRPASAAGVIDPTCTSSSPCIEYDNNGSGPGIRGVSLIGNGSNGITKVNSTSPTNSREGVFGNDLSTSGTYNAGVRGLSVRGTGVLGQSTSGTGVSGASTNSYGVSATSTNNAAVIGQSTNYLGVYGIGPTYGVYGSATTGYGAVGVSNYLGAYGSGGTYGLYGTSSSGRGVFAQSSTGLAFEGHTSGNGTGSLGLLVTNTAGQGGEFDGGYAGIVVKSNSFPLVATNASGANEFYVDGSGNLYYHGTLNSFAVTRTGNVAISYTAKTTSPVVEDTGSAQLINGVATVALDPSFAQTMDPGVPYHVMLTPDGDTRGLFVASKGPSGFIVREIQGGHDSLAFDYHIYATAFGHARERMIVMTRAAATAMGPKVPATARQPLLTPVVPRLKLVP